VYRTCQIEISGNVRDLAASPVKDLSCVEKTEQIKKTDSKLYYENVKYINEEEAEEDIEDID
jgi:hypothetical protein